MLNRSSQEAVPRSGLRVVCIVCDDAFRSSIRNSLLDDRVCCVKRCADAFHLCKFSTQLQHCHMYKKTVYKKTVPDLAKFCLKKTVPDFPTRFLNEFDLLVDSEAYSEYAVQPLFRTFLANSAPTHTSLATICAHRLSKGIFVHFYQIGSQVYMSLSWHAATSYHEPKKPIKKTEDGCAKRLRKSGTT